MPVMPLVSNIPFLCSLHAFVLTKGTDNSKNKQKKGTFMAANMKIFNWNHEKKQLLKQVRGISFEEIVFCIENGLLLDIMEHPNQEKYRGQKMYVVTFNEYVYLVLLPDIFL